MILNYDIFYRTFGVRRLTQLTQPRFGHLDTFQLPRRAIVHLAHGDPTKYGPTEQEFTLRGFASAIEQDGHTLAKPTARPVWMQHVLQFAQPTSGAPIKLNLSPQMLVRQYHQTYRRFRRVSQVEMAQADQNSLMVYNYDMLAHMVRYPRSAFNTYFEWLNIERTMWKEIAKVAEQTDRPQFIVRHMPEILPARSSLQLYEAMTNPNKRVLNTFHSAEHLFLAEVWKWFGPNRKTSLLGVLPRDKLSRINLVFMESGKWMTFNLGMLDSWRKPAEDELMPNEEVLQAQIDPIRYQNRLLRMFMTVAQLRSTAAPEVTELANHTQVLDHDDAAEEKKEFTNIIQKVSSDQGQRDPLTGVLRMQTSTVKMLTPITEVDEPADTAATLVQDDKLEAQIDADIAELEKIQSSVAEETSDEPEETEVIRNDRETVAQVSKMEAPTLTRSTLDKAMMDVVNRHANNGSISAAQYRHYETLSQAYKTLASPNPEQTLEEFINIPAETLKIAQSQEMVDIASVPDKSMMKSSLLEFDERYIEEVMQRDVASMVTGVQRAGIAVTGYEVEAVNNIMGSFNIYTVRLMPSEGSASTVRFKLPAIQPDGSYMANGVKYSLRKQRDEVPIRKTAPDVVTLTSYYGKSFIRRSEKKVNNYATWMNNNLTAKMLDDGDNTITNAHPGDMSDNLFKSPRLYSIFASGFNGFTFNPQSLPAELAGVSFEMMFDHSKREELYGKATLARYEQNGAIIAGKSVTGDMYFLIGKSSTVGIVKDGKITKVAPIETLLGLNRLKAPVDCAVMKVSGESIPLGFILAYELGLEGLIASLGSKVRRVPAGKRLNLAENEEAIIFNDESLVIDRNDHMTCMFLAGFNEYHRHIKRYNMELFNKKDVYFNILEAAGLNVRYIREIDLFYQMFIDPITHDLLVEMDAPTDMRGLLLLAGSMLINDDHPDKLDAASMRIKGYERMAGAVYSELVRTIRSHNGKSGKHRSQLNMDPHAVFMNIQTDASKAQVQDINPIQNLKEKEAVTYNGTGGRNSRTMTRHTRAYHPNDMGTISGDTVDSSDVAINTYTSADPQFTSLRGLSRRYDPSMGATPLLSTSSLLSVGTDHDDPKRANFIGIQHSHGIACNGYHQMPVRTGYEQVIAQRTSDMYAAAAKQDGVVISVARFGVLVKYANGKEQGFEIGRRYGNAAGLTLPHDVVANVELGQAFKRGDILTYNTGFFEPDILNPKNVVWKAGVLVKTVLMEVPETLEDSSALSAKFTNRLVANVSKYSDIVVTFDQVVNKLVKIGDKVGSESILCIIEDAITSQAKLFDAESLDTLKILSNQAPQAKVNGVVERIEVYYHGDKEDMSDSLSAIVTASDRILAERFKSIGQQVLTGAVDEAFRVDGDPLPYDSLCIRVYMTSAMETGEGDKGVFANQMKSVVGKKFVGDYKTESGEEIHAIFGAKSIEDRIVSSPYIIGTTNVLLELAGKRMVAAYRS